MQVFKGKFLQALHSHMHSDDWRRPVNETDSEERERLIQIRKKDWVVHFAKRYNHGKGVATYLSRYVKRCPLKNSQIISVTENQISFRYKSHQTGSIEKMHLTPKAFIDRLVQHIPLFRQSLVRYCGIYTQSKRKNLTIVKTVLGQIIDDVVKVIEWQSYLEQLGKEVKCPQCGGRILQKEKIKSMAC